MFKMDAGSGTEHAEILSKGGIAEREAERKRKQKGVGIRKEVGKRRR